MEPRHSSRATSRPGWLDEDDSSEQNTNPNKKGNHYKSGEGATNKKDQKESLELFCDA
jgi:hypothetical protein